MSTFKDKRNLKAVWQAMHARCKNHNHPQYKDYGGRGINVCQEWNNLSTFIQDMGPRPAKYTLERKDNNKNYCPNNCCWATRKEQTRNKRNNIFICYAGETKILADWCATLNISYGLVFNRFKRGQTPDNMFRRTKWDRV